MEEQYEGTTNTVNSVAGITYLYYIVLAFRSFVMLPDSVIQGYQESPEMYLGVFRDCVG